MKKSAQWLAVISLALMVGGITFVMVYLNAGSGGTIQPPPPPMVDLTFAMKKYPEDGGKVVATEVNQTGHHDFWFYNDSGENLPVGLLKKGCTCSEVNLSIASESWKSRLLAEAAGDLLQRAPRGLEGLPALAAALDPKRVFPELPEKDVTTTQLTTENSVMVPAGAIGCARLSWHRARAESLHLFAELWMGQRGGGLNARLDAAVRIAEPMEVSREVSAGTFDIRELEKGKKAWIVCWSVIRPSFRIKAEQVHTQAKAESDPVEVGEPIPLTAEDLRQMEQSEQTHMLTIKSGYRIPVTLRANAKDGTPMGWGHFLRTVRLTSPNDDGIEPVEVKVTGEVHGDVKVGDKGEGMVSFGPFVSSRGARTSIVLQTDSPDLQLELDSSRLPPYLKVRFPKEPEKSAAGHRSWLLEVEVLPNKANGVFPRADDPVYRDSAIYVKTTETPPRSIRVPVNGTANAG